MILKHLKTIVKNQRGMTLIELILVISVIAIIGSAATATIFQIVRGSGTSNNREVAISNLESAADWFTKDALQAQGRPNQVNPPIINPGDPPPPDELDVDFPITFMWTDYGDDYTSSLDDYEYTCTYTLETSGKLTRTVEKYNIDDVLVSQSTTLVADKISTNTSMSFCEYNWIKEYIVLTLTSIVGTSTPHEVSETRTYKIVSRERLGLGKWE
jgi:prepilin-type N-terminal cleavage/methylation domain-containing protein